MADASMTISSPKERSRTSRQLPAINRIRRLSDVVLRRAGAVQLAAVEPDVPMPTALSDGSALPPNKRWFLYTFFGFVVLPTVVTFFYYAFLASPQYVSEVKFVVRGATQMM